MNFFYVYILESCDNGDHHYTGFTKNLQARLIKHNNGEVSHTSKFRPWKMKTAVAFSEESKARSFERYMKSPSGRAFAKKRL